MATATEKLPMKQAAEKILRERGGPMKADDICEEALDQGLIETKGKTPKATMQAQLSVAASKGDVFVRTMPGTYGLKGRDRKGQKAKPVE